MYIIIYIIYYVYYVLCTIYHRVFVKHVHTCQCVITLPKAHYYCIGNTLMGFTLSPKLLIKIAFYAFNVCKKNIVNHNVL